MDAGYSMLVLAVAVAGHGLVHFVKGPTALLDQLRAEIRDLETKQEGLARELNQVLIRVVGDTYNKQEIRDMFLQLRQDMAELKKAVENRQNGRDGSHGITRQSGH